MWRCLPVDMTVTRQFPQRLPGSGLRREMHDDIGSQRRHCAIPCRGIRDIGELEIDPCVERDGADRHRINLRVQAIEHHHPVKAIGQPR